MKDIMNPCQKEQSIYEAILKTSKKYPNSNALRYFGKTFKYKKVLKRIN